MPECHKCRFNGKGSVACLSCKGPDEDHPIGHSSSRDARGRIVSLDAMAAASGTLDHNRAAPKIRPLGEYQPTAAAFQCTDEQEDAVRRALAVLAKMDDKLVLLFLGLVRGNTVTAVARKLGLSRKTLYEHIKELQAKSPELAAILGRANVEKAHEIDPMETAQTWMDFGS